MDKITLLKREQLEKHDFGEGLILKVFFDNCNGAKNLSMGSVVIEPGCETTLHKRDVEEVIYLVKGNGGVITEDGSEYLLSAGDSVLIPAGISHKHINNGDELLEQIWIFAPQGPEKGLRDLPII